MNTTSASQRLPRPHKSTTLANDALASRKSFPPGITICVLEEDASALEIISGLVLSAGYQVRPFRHPDAFFEFVRIRSPQFSIVNFGGVNATGLTVAARVREVSPTTSVMISLRVHCDGAQRLLPGNEFVNLIERECIAPGSRLAPKATRRGARKVEFARPT